MFMMLTNPVVLIFIISTFLSFIISLIYKIFGNQEKMKEMKERMTDLNKKIKNAREQNNQKEMNKYNKELLKMSSEQMRMQFKPMIVTFIIIIPVFTWIFPSLFGSEPIVHMPFTIFGKESLTWIWWYVIVSLPMGIVFRKILGVAH